jgi:uncharacterized SAM-binding protein YcdF (DUF218 family)
VEFGDTVYATATVVAISILLIVPMDMVFGLELWLVGRVIAVLIAGLITGLIFAGKLAEARVVSIAKIMVLAAIVIMFIVVGMMGAENAFAAFKDSYLEANPEATWTSLQWAQLMNFHAYQNVFRYIVIMDAIGFIGVYIGSMLRKPKKT